MGLIPFKINTEQQQQRLMVISSGFLLVCMLLFTMYELYASRRHDLEGGVRQARARVALIEGHLTSLLQKADVVLQHVEHDLTDDLLRQAPEVMVNRELARFAKDLPEAQNLQIVDHRGQLVYDAAGMASTAVINDHPYFRQLQKDRNAGIVVAAPLYSRYSQSWVVLLARRLSRLDGGFAGVVLVTIPSRYFADAYQVQGAADSSFTLMDRSLVLIARYPLAPEALGKPLPLVSPLHTLIRSGLQSGSYRVVSPLDGVARQHAFKQLKQYPFVISVGFSEAELLHEWQRRVWIYCVGMLLLLAACGEILLRSVHRYRGVAAQAAQYKDEVQRSAVSWRQTFDAMRDPVFIIDADYRISRVNRAALVRLGLSAEEVIGMACHELLQCGGGPPEFCPQTATLADCQCHSTLIHLMSLQGDFQVWTTPIVDEQGQYLASVYVAHDISDFKHRQEELEQARKAAEASSRAKSEFLSNMSHELRTPLNGVIGMAQLLSFTDLSAEQQEYLGNIEIAADNLLSVINDILDLSKIEADRIVLEYTDFSLRTLIDDVVICQKSLIYGKGLQIEIVIDGRLPAALRGDQLRLKQILLNLLGNAVKFTHRGIIKIEARLLADLGKQLQVCLSVHDTGIGMTREVCGRIFAPFVQGDSSVTRRYGGTGLGLTICRRLAQLMGGAISVESEPDVGSRFHVVLPLGVGTTSGQDGHAVALAPVWQGAPLRLLVAEDNKMNASFLKALLEKHGHQVCLAEDGLQVLDAWRREPFDCLLLDIMMPNLDGNQVAVMIRKEEGECHTPLIALTAQAMRHDRERFLQGGFDGYVAKPVKTQQLFNELQRVVARQRSSVSERTKNV